MMPVITTRTRRAASWAAGACALLLPLLVAQPAHAWWARGGWGWGWRGGVVVGPPVIVAPPIVAVARQPVVVAPAPYARWAPPHYNRWGRWVPGHWA